ncbi:SIW14 [[Candida] subhashii]|uniref:diphosphoinositol-polyphosphate diphosphatase n=1 Tax=[Candida] subhashii TaxID=561895 RepID=A0A8J5QL06_9ASCO|nr:SIW14 [[Candida] subhashii]KAG7660445.1 SIW14 [[Candida] subhashii]
MAEFNEDPFQMDEELPQYSESGLSPKTVQFPFNLNSELIPSEISPDYSDILNQQQVYDDDKLIRSRIEQLKFEDGAPNTTTEDESQQDDDVKYDEDLDDKLDLKLQKRLQLEYEQSIKVQLPLTPPENFAPVINRIYRSSFPQPNNFSFLKTLNLKSILCLIPEDYPELQSDFLNHEKIKLFQLGMSGNKEPFVKISSDLITEAVKIVLNPENHPILIHCNRGKHRTGCLVGIIRRLQKWSLTIIFDEYRKFSAPKERPMDQQFIELYDDREITTYCNERNILPLPWD